MSADNWTKCPKCKKQDEDKLATLERDAAVSYGEVSAEIYLGLLKEIAEFKIDMSDDYRHTLREDYEIGIRDGKYEVSYHAGCDKCGFRFKYGHKEPISA